MNNKDDWPSIGIVCNGLIESGGMERHTLDIISGMISRGIKPTVFTKKVDWKLPIVNSVNVVKINCGFLPQRLRMFYVSNKLKKLRDEYKIDVMIGCCRSKNVDIMICGGTHPGYLLSRQKRGWFDKLVCGFEKNAYEESKIIIAHSQRIFEEITKFYPDCKNKIRLLYPPVNFQVFCNKDSEQSVDRDDLRKKLGIPPQNTVFLFVSSSHQRKGFPLLESVFESSVLPISLIVCGRKLPKKDYKNIYELGYQKNMEKIYPQVDFSILASTYEPFGLVTVESIFMGTPVVISNALGSSEVIKETCKVEFDPCSTNSLEEALVHAIEKKATLKSAACRGLDEKFTVDLSLKNYLDQLLAACRKVN